MITEEELYMLLGVKTAEIYELQKEIRLLKNGLNQAKQAVDSESDRSRKSNSRLVDCPKPAEFTNSTLAELSGTEKQTEGL